MLYGDIKQGGWGNKTDPLNYLGHPVSQFGGEFSKQESYLSKGSPLGEQWGNRQLSLFLIQGIPEYIRSDNWPEF